VGGTLPTLLNQEGRYIMFSPSEIVGVRSLLFLGRRQKAPYKSTFVEISWNGLPLVFKSCTYLLTYSTGSVGFMIIINDSCKPGREKKSAYSGVQ
jgi:hypothetical protein